MTKDETVDAMSKALTGGDVALLNHMGCEDETLALLALEHLNRTVTLLKAVQDMRYARHLVLVAATKCMDIAEFLRGEMAGAAHVTAD